MPPISQLLQALASVAGPPPDGYVPPPRDGFRVSAPWNSTRSAIRMAAQRFRACSITNFPMRVNQGKKHGYFDGKTMDVLLTTPAGIAWLKTTVNQPARP